MHNDHDHDHGSDGIWADRVNDAYYDRMGESLGRKTRDRINWMCSKTTGRRILDVGCSQGIASILLAREGYEVIGIDIFPGAIEFANNEREREISQVRERLAFRCTDLDGLEDGSFDTVLMGEVIEHQTNPGRFVAQAGRLLVPGGRLIVTVPFGLHPWPDHKSTVFPDDICGAIADRFVVDLVAVVEGYIRIIATRIEDGVVARLDLDSMLTVMKTGTLEWQQRYYDCSAELGRLKIEISVLTKRQQEMANAQASAAIDAASSDAKVGDLLRTEAMLRERISELETQVQGLKSDAAKSSFLRDNLSARQQELFDQLADAQRAGALASIEVADMAGKLRDADNALEQMNIRIAEAESEAKLVRVELAESAEAGRQKQNELTELMTLQATQERALTEALERARMLEASRMESLIEPGSASLRSELEGERKRSEQIYSELIIAQKKRAGHYAHLEAERARNQALLAVAERLHNENLLYRNSLALALGRALIAAASLKGLVRMPMELWRIVGAHRKRSRHGLPPDPFIPPPLRPVTPNGGKTPTGEMNNGAVDPVVGQVKQIKINGDAARRSLSIRGWDLSGQSAELPVVMSVMDEFSRTCFSPHANFVEPRPDNWEGLMDAAKPQLLFVESTWKGNYGTWQYRVANYSNPPGKELSAMIAGAKERGIPTVFWNKEDPVHFSNFVESASGFDVILTTAEEAIPRYEERSGARVSVLQFAAEESIHNPLGSGMRNRKVCFAGSYYSNRFAERRDDQLMLLDAAARFDLDIFDRNYDPDNPRGSDFAFPERFDAFIRGRMPYREMGKAYREYRVFLNVNSVIDSPTMFSRRVFELLACGTPVVSTWCKGIEETFGNDLVWQVRNKEEAEQALEVLMNDDREWRRRSLLGIRAVMSRHTFKHRFERVLELAGHRSSKPVCGNTVLMTGFANLKAEAEAILANFRRQELQMGMQKKLLLFCGKDVQMGASEDVEIVQDRISDIEEFLHGMGSTDYGAFGFLSPSAAYGKHHVQDALLAIRYSGQEVVGKPANKSDLYTVDVGLNGSSVMFAGTCLKRYARIAKIMSEGGSSVTVEGSGTCAMDIQDYMCAGEVFSPEAQRVFLTGTSDREQQ